MNKQPKYKIDNARLARLVTKAQNGNRRALDEVVNLVSGYLYYYCLTLLGDEEQAKDAVQDILLTVLKKLDALADPKAFLGWLKTIAANYCKTKLSRTRDCVSLDDGAWELADENDQLCPSKSAETEEVCGYVRDAVRALPQLLRESVMMFYFHQMSVRQIAETLEVNENTVKSRLYAARQSMKKYLEQYGGAALASCAVPPLSMVSFSLIQGAEQQRGILIPYVTPEGAVKVASVNAAATGSFSLKAAAVGAACLLVVGGAGTTAILSAAQAGRHTEPVTAPSSQTLTVTQPTSSTPTEPTTARTIEPTTAIPVAADGGDTESTERAPSVQPTQATVAATTAPTESVTEAPTTAAPSTAEAIGTPLTSQIIRIRVGEDTFNGVDRMYCTLYDATAEADVITWQSIRGTMSKIENTDTWSISLARQNITLYSGHEYQIVFTGDWNQNACTETMRFTASANTGEHIAVYTGAYTTSGSGIIRYVYQYEWLE